MNPRERKKLLSLISTLIQDLKKKDKESILNELLGKKDGIPISTFKANISSLEIIVRYLKDNKKLTITEISQLLNRKPTNIHTTYKNSKKKYKKQLNISNNKITIPLDIFQNKKFSILENIVAYLKHNNQSLTQISKLLNKSYNTIKTIYSRYTQKNA